MANRTDDLDSNIVARFPRNFFQDYTEITDLDGATPKIIHTSGTYDPGDEVHSIYIVNDSSSSTTIEFFMGSDTNAPLYTTTMPANTDLHLLDSLPTQLLLGSRGLILPTSYNIYISVTAPFTAPDRLIIQTMGVSY